MMYYSLIQALFVNIFAYACILLIKLVFIETPAYIQCSIIA